MKFKAANFFSSIFLFYCRNISDHPTKLRLVNYIHSLFKDHIKVCSSNGAVLTLIPRDYISREIIFSHAYENKSLDLALEILNNADSGCFLDVGANIGLYSSVIAKSFPDKTIISIEPQENNYKYLVKNLSQNKQNNRIISLNLAVGQDTRLVQLECPQQNNAGAFRVIFQKEDENTGSKYHPMLSLKTILKELGMVNVDLMKIDIEGYEMEAFKGMDWSDDFKPKNIIMEYSDYVSRTGVTADDIMNFLTERGYRAYTVEKSEYQNGDILPESNLWFSL